MVETFSTVVTLREKYPRNKKEFIQCDCKNNIFTCIDTKYFSHKKKENFRQILAFHVEDTLIKTKEFKFK